MDYPLINIHTHQPCADDIICIRNLFISDIQENKHKDSGFFSAGIHPWYIKNEETLVEQLTLLDIAVSDPDCLAIGEAGLDKVSETNWDLQEKALIAQIRISEKSAKPMIIHCVKAWDEILKLRKQEKTTYPWIIHGFNSSEQMAGQLLDAGCLLSFGKMILNSDSKASKALMNLEPEKFFLETDDEEITIVEIYKKAAGLRKVSMAELQKQVAGNFKSIFKTSSN